MGSCLLTFKSMYLLILLLPLLTWCQEDPCIPNPCGANTRCASTMSGANPVISCECLLGYHVPDGGDPFDGCIEQTGPGGTSRGGVGASAAPPPRSTEATIPPLSTLGSVVRESSDLASIVNESTDKVSDAVSESTDQASVEPRALDNDDKNTNRLQAGHRPGQLMPRRKTKPSRDFEDVDNEELFPEDCLVHEDCEESDFCSPPPGNKCVDACTLDVCGVGAVCKSALHRPVCSCPDGFEGNAYDKCTKTKSRVGMKFRRK